MTAIEWDCTAPLSRSEGLELRAQMALQHGKWDLQVGDAGALAPFAITLPSAVVDHLFGAAEQLSTELAHLEAELAERPDLWRQLGLPNRVRQMLDSDLAWTPTAARIIRYDFHWTDAGWRISEANSDVPGGLTESSALVRYFAARTPTTCPTGDPLAELTAALARSRDGPGCVGLIGAPGYPEDLHVIGAVAGALKERGIESVRLSPEQLRWTDGRAYTERGREQIGFGALYRFYQGEWATRVRSPGWAQVFRGGKTPVCNPATAVLTESKRLPVLWPELRTAVPTWRRLLPPTWPIRRAFRCRDRVYKGAYSNNGECVTSPSWSRQRAQFSTWIEAALHPDRRVAQERFRAVPLESPTGPVFPCFGVFTVNGRACGMYGRISANPLIDYTAQDVAVLRRL